MFASATSGDKPNNAKFSSCSINNISSVLHVVDLYFNFVVYLLIEVLSSVPVDPTKYFGPVGPLTKRNCFQGCLFWVDLIFYYFRKDISILRKSDS